MSLKYAILGFLSLHPMTGYDLKTRYFDGSVGNFWPADQAQIYRTLGQLSDAGWVESTVEVQTAHPNRKVYSLTPSGVDGLKRWLRVSRPLAAERIPFLVQLYFARHLSADELLALLRDQLRQHEERLLHYQQIELPVADNALMAEQLKFGAMTLSYGLRHEQMKVDWLTDLIAQVENDAS